MLILFTTAIIKYKNVVSNGMILWHINPLLGSDSINSGRCLITPATCTRSTMEERGYATRFLKKVSVNSSPGNGHKSNNRTVFSMQSVRSGYKEVQSVANSSTESSGVE
jgi:hypothetical protein